ncbi:hypothetical protein GCM10010406_21300 [Streptomyces thermolineatus]|uniref:Uncharacterized protein n=1 Tax=Streptomyces thermolineatus TaxID=44033 RepID=A0ABN3LIA7_9ACTN
MDCDETACQLDTLIRLDHAAVALAGRISTGKTSPGALIASRARDMEIRRTVREFDTALADFEDRYGPLPGSEAAAGWTT